MPAKIVRLKYTGSFEGEAKASEDKSYIDKPCLMVYCGKFDSMDGEVEIKDEDIEKLAANHNTFLAKMSRLANGEHHPKHNPPIQLDHSTSARDTVGRMRGNLSVGEHTLEDGTKVKALMGSARVLGRDNVEKVEDGRWANLSGGFDLENHRVTELTITPFPAAPDASMLSNQKLSSEDTVGYKELKEKMDLYGKCKKHLKEFKKMSDEDADKHLEEAKDEDLKKMAAEEDDRDKKLAAEKDDQEKKEKDAKDAEMKRMAGLKDGKAKFVELSKGLKATGVKVQLAAKKASITTRLSKLQAETKITPAERKGLNIDELAGKSDEVINAALSSYDKREPVIDVGVYGSTKAMTAGMLHKKLKAMDSEVDELRTRLAMSTKRPEALKRLSELGLTESDLEKGVTVQTEKQDGTDNNVDFEASYATMKKLMSEGKEDEAKAHFKSHMGKGPVGTEVVGPDQTQEMSALAEEVRKMQTNFDEVVRLAAPIFGATQEELA